MEDIIGSLIEGSSDENIFYTQPCRDNTLYLLRLTDELLISESGDKLLVFGFDLIRSLSLIAMYKFLSNIISGSLLLQFPGSGISSDISSDYMHPESHKDMTAAVFEILNNEFDDQPPRYGDTIHGGFVNTMYSQGQSH